MLNTRSRSIQLCATLACAIAVAGPSHGQSGTPPAVPAKKSLDKQSRTEVELIDLENPDAPFEVRMTTEGGKVGFVEGERFKITISADVDCYITVLAVAPSGEISTIVPGPAHASDKKSRQVHLKKGKTLELPAGEAKFKAEPPHGQTRFKVFATTEPLTIAEDKPGEKYRELLEGLKGVGVDSDGDGPDPLGGKNWSTDDLVITTGANEADLERRLADPDGSDPVEAEPDAPASDKPRPPRSNPKPPLAPKADPDPNDAYREKWEAIVKASQGSKAIGTRFVPSRSVFERSVEWEAASELLVVRGSPAGSKAAGGHYRTERVALGKPGSKAVGDEAVRQRVEEIKKSDPSVLAVLPNDTWRTFAAEQAEGPKSNPFSGLQWHLNNSELSGNDVGWFYKAVDLVEATPVTIGVVDQGLHLNEPRLAPYIWTNPNEVASNGKDDDGNGLVDDVHGWNFAAGNAELSTSDDRENHGTYCTSIIVGGDPGQPGYFFGVTYNAKIIPSACMAYDEAKHTATGSIETTLEAIRYAADHGAKVINLSLGGPSTPLAILLLDNHPLWDELEAKGVLLVIAAGNENSDIDANPVAPACLPRENTIVVMATDPAGKQARGYNGTEWVQYSNWGRNSVHIAAPGTMVLGIPSVDSTSYGDGTSYAAPIVTAIAATIWGQHPDWDWKTVKRAILETARPVEGLDDKCLTGGIVDFRAALEWTP